jgi:Protein of unknown function (DUF2852)
MPLAILMILGFWVWWPLGLLALAFMIGGWLWWPLGIAFLAFIIWSQKMSCWNNHGMTRWENKMQRMQDKMDRVRSKIEGMGLGGGMRGGWGGPPSSGNRAFDDYRTETLKRLEDEQREFRDFLDRLRFAKDKTEFDQFMAERRNRVPDNGPQPQS